MLPENRFQMVPWEVSMHGAQELEASGGGGGGWQHGGHGGGGGGFSGGGTGGNGYYGGGGGGSYNSGIDQNNTVGANEGHGKVIITTYSSSNNQTESPVITQGAGPLTKTLEEDSNATWTASELNATDSDTNATSLCLVTAFLTQ